ncbi:MAG TPA: hypothetical protein VMB18_07305 [Terriglobales bacterium]|nr:hypothetical protein [Terriglobales bacterium]
MAKGIRSAWLVFALAVGASTSLSAQLHFSVVDRQAVEQRLKSYQGSDRVREVPIVAIHSLTQDTMRVLHSRRDNYSAVHFDDYYNSYRLISAYLAFLDEGLSTQPTEKK